MVKRRGRKSRRRMFGRRARRSAGRALSVGPRLFGFTKGGFKVSRAVMAGSALITPFIPAYGGLSAVNCIMKPNYPLQSKLKEALGCMLWVGLGQNVKALTGNDSGMADTKGITGMGVVAGAGLAVAGKFANPFLKGSPVKL